MTSSSPSTGTYQASPDKSSSKTQKATEGINLALERLNNAMTSLEKSIQKAKTAPKQDTQQEIHLVNLDRARLGQELQTLKDDFSNLENTTSRVIKKLDATIQTLRTVLQDNEPHESNNQAPATQTI